MNNKTAQSGLSHFVYEKSEGAQAMRSQRLLKISDLPRVVHIVIALTFALACSRSTLLADDGNRLHGCVRDGNGRPVLRASVVAYAGNWFGDSKKKVEVDRSTGCYEIKDLKNGTYKVYLEDTNYDRRISPPQGIARLSFGGTAEVNLSINFPDNRDLAAGLFEVFRSVPSGFVDLRDHQIVDRDELFGLARPPDYVAHRIPSFNDCAIRYDSDRSFFFADHECRLQTMLGLDFAETAYKKIRDAVTLTLGSTFPDFGPAKQGDCGIVTAELRQYCLEHTEWSTSNAFVHVWMSHARSSQKEFYLRFLVTVAKPAVAKE